jgi:hypothetical protein
LPRAVLFSEEETELNGLNVVVGSVIILGGGLSASVRALLEPGKKLLKPFLNSLLIG